MLVEVKKVMAISSMAIIVVMSVMEDVALAIEAMVSVADAVVDIVMPDMAIPGMDMVAMLIWCRAWRNRCRMPEAEEL